MLALIVYIRCLQKAIIQLAETYIDIESKSNIWVEVNIIYKLGGYLTEAIIVTLVMGL
jgi:hypothetical protein